MAEIIRVNPEAPSPAAIARAAELLRRGEVVAIPTDTVYGLAADPFNESAVQRLFAVKGRSPDAPVPLLVDSIEMAAEVAGELPALFHPLAGRYWPGPLTIVMESSRRVPAVVSANTGRVGLRLPAAAIPQAIVRALGSPITGTSANRSGQPECRSAEEVEASLGEFLPLILDGGPSPGARPSTVVSLAGESWTLVREGAVPLAELEAFFRQVRTGKLEPE